MYRLSDFYFQMILFGLGSPVERIGVQVQDFQWSGIRFIRQLMNQQPLFILSYYTYLKYTGTMGNMNI